MIVETARSNEFDLVVDAHFLDRQVGHGELQMLALVADTPRFGIVHVDYWTQERLIRDSGRFWASVARDGLPAGRDDPALIRVGRCAHGECFRQPTGDGR